jgi:2-polyprenyl-6-methoxyphenol hydroxylase-like FAD-dependent oxidoreductase
MGPPSGSAAPAPAVLIVGAGIAGLAAATLLGRAGWSVRVVERDSEMRGGGFLVSLSHDAYRAADRLGVIDPLRARVHHIRRSSYHDPRGHRLLSLDYERLFGPLDVIQPMRNDLAIALLACLPETVRIDRGVEPTRIAHRPDGAEVSLSDGTDAAYDVVIGTDGVHSATRRLAFADVPIARHSLGLFCAAYRLPNVLGLEREFRTYMERDRYMACFATAPDEIGAVFVWAEAADAPPADPAARASLLRDAFRGAAPETSQALAHCPDSRSFYMDRLEQVELARWHEGRVCLVGDAAHCLTLFSGRGAAAALVGATRLADRLIEAPDDPTGAFARHQADQKPKIDAMQRATREAVKWYVPRSRAIETMRNSAMRVLPRRVFESYFQAKYRTV